MPLSGMDLLVQAATGSVNTVGTRSSSNMSRVSGTTEDRRTLVTSSSASISAESLSVHRKISRSGSNGSLPPKKRMRRHASCDFERRVNPFQLQVNMVQSDTSLSTLGMSVTSARPLASSSRYDSSYTMVSHGSSVSSKSTNSNSEWTAADLSQQMRLQEKGCNLLQLCSDAGLILPNRQASKNSLQLKRSIKKIFPKINEEFVGSSLPRSSGMVKFRSVSDASTEGSTTKRKKNYTMEVKDLNGNDMGMGYFSSMGSLK